MPKYVRQLCFVLIGLPALLALALSGSGKHGALPFLAVVVCWLSVQLTRNFTVVAPDSQSDLHLALIDETLRMAVISSAVSALVLAGAKFLAVTTVFAQLLNVGVLGWWLAFAGWTLLQANLVMWSETGARSR